MSQSEALLSTILSDGWCRTKKEPTLQLRRAGSREEMAPDRSQGRCPPDHSGEPRVGHEHAAEIQIVMPA